MAYFSDRLPHVVTRGDLAVLLTPVYTAAVSVDDGEASDRLLRALADEGFLDELYTSLSAALAARPGARTSVDALMDKLSKGVGARRSRIKAPAASPELSAVVVRINLLIGEAPETMGALMQTEKGRAAVQKGLQTLGTHLVRELLK